MNDKKRSTGFLFNEENPYPKGKCFFDPIEYARALEEGWNTGPVDAYRAKLIDEKETKEPDFFEVEPKKRPGRPKKDKK